MNIRIAQYKHGGVAPNLDIYENIHPRGMRGMNGDSILLPTIEGTYLGQL